MTTLQATNRTADENVAGLRASGKIPAVIYGSGIKTPISITIEREAFKKAWAQAGSSTAVTVTGAGENHDVIIHDFQIDPRTDVVIHADLLALDKNTKVTVKVELEFVGTSPAVKAGLGILEKALHEIEVEALPANLPKTLEVSIDGLVDTHSQIHIKDIALPKGVEIKGHEADDVVALISVIADEVETPTTIDFDSIEVEKKGKKDDETDEVVEESK